MRKSSECHSSPARTAWLSVRSSSSQPVVVTNEILSRHQLCAIRFVTPIAATRRMTPARMRFMGKRSRRRAGGNDSPPAATTDYTDEDGNVLTLRDSVSPSTLAQLREPAGGAAATVDDQWRRRTEMLFERLTVRWEIAGLPIDKQKELLGRYRMASQAEQQWVRATLDAHLRAIDTN